MGTSGSGGTPEIQGRAGSGANAVSLRATRECVRHRPLALKGFRPARSLCNFRVLPHLMAVVTPNTRLLNPMAFHAAAHREIRLLREPLPRRHRPVTFLARIARTQMLPMTEIRKARNLIHP